MRLSFRTCMTRLAIGFGGLESMLCDLRVSASLARPKLPGQEEKNFLMKFTDDNKDSIYSGKCALSCADLQIVDVFVMIDSSSRNLF